MSALRPLQRSVILSGAERTGERSERGAEAEPKDDASQH